MYSLENQPNIGQTAKAEWDILCLSKRRKFGSEIRKANQKPEDDRFDSMFKLVQLFQPETALMLYYL